MNKNDDIRIEKACEFLLNHSQDKISSGFSICRNARIGGGRHSGVIPCLTGNMVYSFIRLGYLTDHRIQKGIQWITDYQLYKKSHDLSKIAKPGWLRFDIRLGMIVD